jgi:hypothetical protein
MRVPNLVGVATGTCADMSGAPRFVLVLRFVFVGLLLAISRLHPLGLSCCDQSQSSL